MFVVYRALLNIVFLGGVKHVVCSVRGVTDVVFSVCILTHGAVGGRVWEV